MGITDRGGVRGEQSNLVRFEAVAADGIAAAATADAAVGIASVAAIVAADASLIEDAAIA
jgi:hypothetical protein